MMASVILMHACTQAGVAGKAENRAFSQWIRGQCFRISSVCHNAGSSDLLFRHGCEIGRGVSLCSSKSAVIRCAVSKQKKKVKDRKRSSGTDKQWKFDEMMVVWDDAFQKFCDDTSIATSLLLLSRNGFSQYGRGCVLMEEAVNTKPRGAASGFSHKSRYCSSDAPELPFYVSLGWKACYVPLDFINDPCKAPESFANPETEPDSGAVIRLVDQAKLLSVLRGMDRTRLQGLLTDPNSGAPEDAGGEDPYDSSKNDVVVMFALTVDGQQAVGADVLRAYPVAAAADNGETLWTLQMRDGDGSQFVS